jgi:hypothetical protein
MGDQLYHKAATYTEQHKHRITMPRVGFEPTAPVSERTQIFHTLHRESSVIG